MPTLEEFEKLALEAGNDDAHIHFEGDPPTLAISESKVGDSLPGRQSPANDQALQDFRAALIGRYGEVIGKGAFGDAKLDDKQEKQGALTVRDVKEAIGRAEVRTGWKTVHFYVPFTAEQVHETQRRAVDAGAQQFLWDGKMSQWGAKRGIPDVLEPVLVYRDQQEKAGNRNVGIILAKDGSEALKSLKPEDTLYIFSHGVSNGTRSLDYLLSSDEMDDDNKLIGMEVTAEEIAELLRDDGVSNAVGKVKLFSCYSNDGETNSFAEKFHEARDKFGLFPDAEVSSYKGELQLNNNKVMVERDGVSVKETHKSSLEAGDEKEDVRASLAAYVRKENGGSVSYVPRKDVRPPKVGNV